MGVITTAGLVLAETRGDDTVVVDALPVAGTSRTWRTVLRLALPVCAGDVLDVYADAKVTNDAGRGKTRYTVGVGYHLWHYNASVPSGTARDATWTQIGASLGENVTVDTHHLALNIGRLLQVPDDWRDGDVMGVALRAAAMSTRWDANGGRDVLTVDGDGALVVRRWTQPYGEGP